MKVRDYVRFKINKKTYIGKIVNINEYREPSMKYAVDCQIVPDYAFIGDEDILKSSSNIIDLIEVGDYVNGMEVTRIGGTYYGRKDIAIYCEHNGNENWKQVMIYDDEIKSILTKELFESMKYKIGEDNE